MAIDKKVFEHFKLSFNCLVSCYYLVIFEPCKPVQTNKFCICLSNIIKGPTLNSYAPIKNTTCELSLYCRLAKCWNADIVTSLSALRTLADNSPPFDKEWEMPMIIEHLEGCTSYTDNCQISFCCEAAFILSFNTSFLT